MIYRQTANSKLKNTFFKNILLRLLVFQAINLTIIFLLALHLPYMTYKAVPLLIIVLMFDYYSLSKTFNFNLNR